MSNTSFLGNSKIANGQLDTRYRLSIFLVVQGRPSYWDFHCNKCTRKIAELAGDMVMISDADDIECYHKHPAPIVVKCPGNYCKILYEFITLGVRSIRPVVSL